MACSPKKAPEAKATPPPETDARAQLRRELDRWCACREFVYQFSLIAKPKPKPSPPSPKKRRGRHGGSDGRRPRRQRPTPIKARKLGLAAVKHQQQQAERTQQQGQQGRAFVALAHVVADAGGGGWPESMQRELQGCKTPQEKNAWAVKWGAYLSGQVEREKRGAPERPPPRGKDGGGACQPS